MPSSANEDPQVTERPHTILNSEDQVDQLFTYFPLPTPTSIRILGLYGGEGDIHCSIATYELEHPPQYLALSYTWGCPYADPNFEVDDPLLSNDIRIEFQHSIPITCNCCRLNVTFNLFEALQNIRSRFVALYWDKGKVDSHTPFWLWIDAICINQNDPAERNAQVALMANIYFSAFMVMAWLGNRLPRTKVALNLIKYLNTIPEEKWSQMAKKSLHSTETYQTLGLRYISPEEWKALHSFMERKWFRRIWILQEYGLSKSMVMVCGYEPIEYLAVYAVARLLQKTSWCHQLDGALYNFSVLRPRTVHHGVPGVGPLVLQIFRQFASGSVGVKSINEVLFLGRVCGATDPRDRVYALLPVLNLWAEKMPRLEKIRPDYNKSVQVVFIEMMRWAIQVKGNLNTLSYIGDISVRNTPHLPSWVPDLSGATTPDSLWGVGRSWSAPGDTQYRSPEIFDLRTLMLQGACIDTIMEGSCVYESHDTGQCCSWLNLAALLKVPYRNGQLSNGSLMENSHSRHCHWYSSSWT